MTFRDLISIEADFFFVSNCELERTKFKRVFRFCFFLLIVSNKSSILPFPSGAVSLGGDRYLEHLHSTLVTKSARFGDRPDAQNRRRKKSNHYEMNNGLGRKTTLETRSVNMLLKGVGWLSLVEWVCVSLRI